MTIQAGQHNYQYYKTVFHRYQMPFAFVDLDLLGANIRQTIARAGTKRIRLASKSIRAVALVKKILAANPVFQGVMCFTAPEAVWLSRRGLDDLLLGYPCWNAELIRAICAEVRQGKTIVLMIDSAEHAEHLAGIAAAEGVTLPVCLDLDMALDLPGLHFGV